MKITEIFYSVQGEGVNVGVPSVFVRLFGCNLSCEWCDTKYAWHKDFARFEKMSAFEAVEQICSYGLSNNVVFTGGEPALLQEQIRDVQQLLIERSDSFTFEIETNGSLAIEDDFWNTINISPKLTNSDTPPYEILANTYPAKSWWKFVVESEVDMPEILALIEQHKVPRNHVLLMPQAQRRDELIKASEPVIELCKRHGFRFGQRLQVMVYCDKPGV
jgi:7-carboxy-7-deazaguanine synthase